MRPPDLAIPKKQIEPAILYAKSAGVEHIAFMSLLLAEKNSFVRHHKIEKLIVAPGVPYTFLRPSFFMQNLSTTHALEIKSMNEILVPAGRGKTSFIDVRDIAAVAVEALTKDGLKITALPLIRPSSPSRSPRCLQRRFLKRQGQAMSAQRGNQRISWLSQALGKLREGIPTTSSRGQFRF